jgi:hypothetical protein
MTFSADERTADLVIRKLHRLITILDIEIANITQHSKRENPPLRAEELEDEEEADRRGTGV